MSEPAPASPAFVALCTGQLLWSLQLAQAAIFSAFGVTEPGDPRPTCCAEGCDCACTESNTAIRGNP
ncbi:hypothetical protein ACW2Q0_28340 [Nocardia sp. R16R-3T]